MVGASLVLPLGTQPAVAAPGVIEGTVFRDWNQNGVQDLAGGGNLAEPGVAGIEVRASDAAGTVVGPSTSAADGRYSISLSGLSDAVSSTFRVEFTIPADQSFLQPGPVPATSTIGMVRNQTSVQFTTATGPVMAGFPGADFGVANPADYCQANPQVVSPCYIAGTSKSTLGTLKAFPYQDGFLTLPPPPTDLARQADIGSTWGLAWDRTGQRLFEAAFTKRHAAYGPGTPGVVSGQIFVTDPSVPSSSVLLAIPAGPDLHDYAAGNDLDTDDTVWDAVGHTAFGDLDIAEDDALLYVTNLFDRRLYRVDPNATPPAVVDSVSFPDPGPGSTGCPLDPSTPSGELNKNLVPGGLEIHDGVVYAALTCTAANVPGQTNVNTPTARTPPTPMRSLDGRSSGGSSTSSTARSPRWPISASTTPGDAPRSRARAVSRPDGSRGPDQDAARRPRLRPWELSPAMADGHRDRRAGLHGRRDRGPLRAPVRQSWVGGGGGARASPPATRFAWLPRARRGTWRTTVSSVRNSRQVASAPARAQVAASSTSRTCSPPITRRSASAGWDTSRERATCSRPSSTPTRT